MGLFSRKRSDTDTNDDFYPNAKSDLSSGESPQNIFIKRISLENTRDFTVVRQNLLDGHIIVIDLTSLIEQANNPTGDKNSLQTQIQLIRQYCLQNGGKVLKLKQNLMLITPNNRFQIKQNN